MKDRQFLYYGMYILAMLVFGTNGYYVTHISLSGSQIVLFRTLIGGILLTAMIVLRGGFDRPSLQSDAVPLLCGGVALGLNWVALFEAYRLLNVSLATLIYYVGPVLFLLSSPFLLHEKLSGTKVAAVCIVLIGLVCISGSIVADGMSSTGLFAAVMSALFYAVLIAFNKRVVKTGGMQTAAVELDAAFIVVLLYVLLTTALPRPQAADLPYLAAIGLINTGLAYFLYFSGLQKLPGQTVALLSYVDPVSALLFSAVLLNEVLTPLQLAGTVLIIGGAMFGETRA